MKPTLLRLLPCLWLLLSVIAPPVSAQEPGAKSPNESTESVRADEPRAIPIESIVVRSEALSSRLDEIRANIALGQARADALSGLSDLEAEISSARSGFEGVLERSRGSADLAPHRARWAAFESEVGTLLETVFERSDAVSAWLSEVQEASEVWLLTRQKARADTESESALARIESVLDGLDASEHELRAARDEILDLESRVLGQRQSVRSDLAQIDARRSELSGIFFERQDPPLWRLNRVDRQLLSFREHLQGLWADFESYVRRSRKLFLIQALLILGLTWLVRRVRDALPEELGHIPVRPGSGLRRPAAVVAYPWSIGVVLGLWATPILHAELSLSLVLLAGLLSLPVWLRLVNGLVPRHRNLFRSLALLASIDAAFFVSQGFPPVDRILLLLKCLGGVTVAGLLLRHGTFSSNHDEDGATPPARPLVAAWTRISAASMAIATLAVIAGYSQLAEVVASTIIWGSIGLTVLLLMVSVAEVAALAMVDFGDQRGIPALRVHLERVTREVGTVAWAVGIGLGAYVLLKLLGVWGQTWDAVSGILSAEHQTGSLTLSLGGLLGFGLALWLSWMVARLTSFILGEVVLPRRDLPPGVPAALTSLTHYAILFVGVMIAIRTLGLPLAQLTVVIGALSVGIGFGLQNVVNNFISGILILVERPIRKGDRVQLDDLEGHVTKIGIRASNVLTVDGSDIIVPNSEFISSRVINWSLQDPNRRVMVSVGVAYGTDTRMVLEVLSRIARQHPEVKSYPEPSAMFSGFGDSSLDFQVLAWTSNERWRQVSSDLAVAIDGEFKERGIKIPFPQRDLHIQSPEPSTKPEVGVSGQTPS